MMATFCACTASITFGETPKKLRNEIAGLFACGVKLTEDEEVVAPAHEGDEDPSGFALKDEGRIPSACK